MVAGMAAEARTVFWRATRPSVCRQCLRRLRISSVPLASSRPFSETSSSSPRATADADPAGRPRWQRTPPAMVAPFRRRPVPAGGLFVANSDPRKLDTFYTEFFGQRGAQLQLSEEVRWQAVTHKSFDHGRRGFNGRLAFLGKRILDLQTSQALLAAPSSALENMADARDKHGRPVFHDPALAKLEQLSPRSRQSAVDRQRLARLAESYGMQRVVRWKPRMPDNLQASGIDSVLTHTLYAIIGALALEQGGAVANATVRERVLRPLGL